MRCSNTNTLFMRGSEQHLSVKQAPDWLRRGLFCSGSAAIFLSRSKWTAVMCSRWHKSLSPCFALAGDVLMNSSSALGLHLLNATR